MVAAGGEEGEQGMPCLRKSRGSSPRDERGLTLAEVVVIILTVAILAAVLLPALNRPHSHRRNRCMSNLKQFGLALNMYAQDYNEKFPSTVGYNRKGSAPIALRPGDGLGALELLYTHGYLTDPDVCACPTGRPKVDPNDAKKGVAAAGCTPLNTSYGYDPRHVTTHPASTAVMADRPDPKSPTANSPNHSGDGQNVLYIDGHVSWYAKTDCGYENNEIYSGADDGDAVSATEGASHIIQ